MRADLPPSVVASWLVQNGRSRYQRAIAADGIEARYPFAGLVAVAESIPGDERSAETAVTTVRDIFGEGIAYGVGEALADAVEEASERLRDLDLQGCSLAAAAYLGDRVWIAHRGSCRIYRIGKGPAIQLNRENTLAVQMGLGTDSPGFQERSRDLTAYLGQRRAVPETDELVMQPGEGVLLTTAGTWLQLSREDLDGFVCGEQGLTGLSGRARLRFRRQGGALASICFQEGRRWRVSRRRLLGALPAILTTLILAGIVYLAVRLVSCEETEVPPDGADSTGVVLPLERPQPEDTAAIAEPPSIEPLGTLVLADDSLELDYLRFRQTPTGGVPDPEWERFTPAVYTLAGDSLTDSTKASLAEASGSDSILVVRRIVVVRDDQLGAFSRWLEELDPEVAESTAVVVEAGASVAGGASWTRRFPLFVNGDRENAGLPSVYIGDSADDIPAIPDSSAYRIVVVPGSLD